MREIYSTLFPSLSSRATSLIFAGVQALALQKQEEKGLDVLVKQLVATAERPVREIDESRPRTERWGNKDQLTYKFSKWKCLTVCALFFHHVKAATMTSQGWGFVQGPPGQPDNGHTEEQERDMEKSTSEGTNTLRYMINRPWHKR